MNISDTSIQYGDNNNRIEEVEVTYGPNSVVQSNIPNLKGGGRKKVEVKSRKRKRNPECWVKNIRKKLKIQGKEYTTMKGKVIPAKIMKLPCSCKRKCFDKINYAQRLIIFENYYSLTLDGQNQFISSSVEEISKKTERIKINNIPSRRQFSKKYFLTKNNEKIEVCQIMFMNTLNVSQKIIRVTVAKKSSTGSGVCLSDGRGHHLNHIKAPDEDKDIIRNHIKMFPVNNSHYSRNHTYRKYFLNPDLSISKMYQLYKTHCIENNYNMLSEFMYRKIFVEDFNLAFKKPSNDTCQLCDKLETIIKCSAVNEDVQDAIKEKDEHLKMADMAYQEKKMIKL